MQSSEWSTIVGAILSGSALPSIYRFVRRRIFRDSKEEAEARKLNVEADDLIVSRLWAEIERLDRELKAVRDELTTVKTTAEDEKTHLETENKRLRMEVGALRTRVGQLEEILKTKTTPEDMQELLDKLKDAE